MNLLKNNNYESDQEELEDRRSPNSREETQLNEDLTLIPYSYQNPDSDHLSRPITPVNTVVPFQQDYTPNPTETRKRPFFASPIQNLFTGAFSGFSNNLFSNRKTKGKGIAPLGIPGSSTQTTEAQEAFSTPESRHISWTDNSDQWDNFTEEQLQVQRFQQARQFQNNQ